jgi:ribosomal protein S16
MPMHLDFRWYNGKVIEMLGYYDPATMNEEIAAWKVANK